jgi:electron transfer flavoprotein alpha subunit
MAIEYARGPVWVLAEQTDGQLLSVSLQLMGHARTLADQLGVSAEAILLGNRVGDAARQLVAAGADRVYVGDAPHLAIYQPEAYTKIAVELAREHKPDILLLGSTPMGRELAPLVAARLETGLTAHCIDLVLDQNGILEQQVPAYGGLISIICPERRPQMATVAKGVFLNPELDESRVGEIVRLDIADEAFRHVQTLEIVREEPKGVPLETAQVVVTGGAGVGDAEGWQSIVKLAQVLNAGLGSTRPIVDEGWSELETMIGQSGKMVSPTLYIGVALSGEQQHMVGITDAQVMVAINNDENAPVFEQVDLGIVDDCREFVPVLIRRIQEVQTR